MLLRAVPQRMIPPRTAQKAMLQALQAGCNSRLALSETLPVRPQAARKALVLRRDAQKAILLPWAARKALVQPMQAGYNCGLVRPQAAQKALVLRWDAQKAAWKALAQPMPAGYNCGLALLETLPGQRQAAQKPLFLPLDAQMAMAMSLPWAAARSLAQPPQAECNWDVALAEPPPGLTRAVQGSLAQPLQVGYNSGPALLGTLPGLPRAVQKSIVLPLVAQKPLLLLKAAQKALSLLRAAKLSLFQAVQAECNSRLARWAMLPAALHFAAFLLAAVAP